LSGREELPGGGYLFGVCADVDLFGGIVDAGAGVEFDVFAGSGGVELEAAELASGFATVEWV